MIKTLPSGADLDKKEGILLTSLIPSVPSPYFILHNSPSLFWGPASSGESQVRHLTYKALHALPIRVSSHISHYSFYSNPQL